MARRYLVAEPGPDDRSRAPRCHRASDRVVVVFTPDGRASKWVRHEWEYALEAEKIVNPVLRSLPPEDIPRELAGLHWVNFSDDSKYQDGLRTLVRVLAEEPPRFGQLVGVPDLPAHFVPRTPVFQKLKGALLHGITRPVRVASARRKIGIYGMAGLGKSLMTAALARDTDIRRHFPDGIVWITVGRAPDIQSEQARLVAALGAHRRKKDRRAGAIGLGELLQKSSALIVLDDVWDAKQIAAFDTPGPKSRFIVTTRFKGFLAVERSINTLSDAEALTLLAKAADQPKSAPPKESKLVIRECGNLPLALALVGSLLRARKKAWKSVLKSLRAGKLARFANRSEYPYSNLSRALQVSVDDLPPASRARYLDFSLFPEPINIRETTLKTLWAHGPHSLTNEQVEDLIDEFEHRSLVRKMPDDRVTLHDLQYDYLREQVHDTSILHARLIEAYRKRSKNGWASIPDDGYFHEHLVHHLIAAKRPDDVHRLLAVGSSQGARAWYRAKLASDSMDGFVRDVSQAASLARSEFSAAHAQVAAKAVSLQCQYALAISSVDTNIPPRLIVPLVQEGIWSMTSALDHCNQIADERRRCASIVRLRGELTTKQQLERAIGIISDIEDPAVRAEGFAAVSGVRPLSPSKKPELQRKAISAILEIPREEVHSPRHEVLKRVLSYFTGANSEISNHIRKLWRSIKGSWERGESLPYAARYLPDDEKRQACLDILEHRKRDLHSELGLEEVVAPRITALVPQLPDPLVEKVSDLVELLDDPWHRGVLIRALLLRSQDRIGKRCLHLALSRAGSEGDARDRLGLLIPLYRFLPADLQRSVVRDGMQAGPVIQALGGGSIIEHFWTERLMRLASEVEEDEQEPLFERMLHTYIEADRRLRPWARASNPLAVLPGSTRTYFKQILAACEQIPYDGTESDELTFLIGASVRLLGVVTAVGRQRGGRIQTLADALFLGAEDRYSGELRTRPMTADGVIDAFRAHSGPRWKAVLQRGLATLRIRDEPSAVRAIAELTRCAERPLEGAGLDATLVPARRIADDYSRATALTKLVPVAMPAARNSLIDEAMAAARSISKEHPSRARAMITIGLAVQDVAPLVPEIMEGASASIMMYGVVDDLCALVPKLPEAALEQVLSLARRKPYWNAVDILTALLPRLPERLVPQALDIAHEYDDEFWRAMAIASVAGRLPEPAKETELRLAYRLSVGLPPEHRAMILSKVAENARESDRLSRWGPALEQACEAADLPFDEDRPFEETIKVFTSMIPRLPQSLKETVLERSSSFPPGLREQVLVTLIPELDEILMTQTLEVCRHFHGYEWEQAQALMTIAERLRPLPWQRILAIANRMEDAFEQTRVITALAARSDGARRKFLVAKAKQHSGRISNGWKRASALASLSRLVSPPYAERLLLAGWKSVAPGEHLLGPRDGESRADFLRLLVTATSNLPAQRAHPIFSAALERLVEQERGDLLDDLSVLAPLIAHVGTAGSIPAVAKAVHDVEAFWP